MGQPPFLSSQKPALSLDHTSDCFLHVLYQLVEMAFPNYLTPQTVVDLRGRIASSAIGGAPSISQKLALGIAKQSQSQWCWAATSSSIASFYDPASHWTQCLIANACLSRYDCCNSSAAGSTACNRAWYLDRALSVTGNFARIETRGLTFAEIQAEIARDAPVGTRVGWKGGGGHFQAIVGWLVGASGTEYIDISDPIYLDTQMVYSHFASTYQAGGRWTHSYITRSASGVTVAAAGGAQFAATELDPDALGA